MSHRGSTRAAACCPEDERVRRGPGPRCTVGRIPADGQARGMMGRRLMHRRSLLQGIAVAGAALSAPAFAQGTPRTLRFIPQIDLAFLDPHWTTANVTRNHGYMVFDTLYGLDQQDVAHPQMAEGHTVEDDGKRWTIRLREGLLFHDGTPVLTRDCVASIRRWGARDAFGGALMRATDEISALDDRTIAFRLKKPF